MSGRKAMIARHVSGKPSQAIEAILGTDLQWVTAEALCAQTDSELFFPERGRRANEARRLCAGCPLLDPCRNYAATHDVVGVWGGTAEFERNRGVA